MVGLSQKRIREYEKEGLIKPERAPHTNNRLYSAADVKQIARIKQLIHENGFTLACLRYFLAAAPCWLIYGCGEKESCPAYRSPHQPCYHIMRKSAHSLFKKCDACPVFLNRDVEKINILEKD
jgi:hypothetical protein